MSWKSFVSAGLLCVLASPLFAAPTLRVVNGPALNAQGNWVWTVSVETSFTDTPIAAELGFDASSAVVSATKGADFDGANTDNPGGDIFGTAVDDDWENYGTSGFPEGVQINADQVFAAIGSDTTALPNSPTQSTILTIVTSGPTSAGGGNIGSLQVLGAYGAGGDEGRLAELTGATTSANYRGYIGTATRTLDGGDMDLSGTIGPEDAAAFGFNWPLASVTGGWTDGDFDRSGALDPGDAAYFGFEWNTPGGASISNLTVTGILDPPPGGGSGGAGAIPEPASIALAGLALLGGLGLLRRRG